MAKKIKKGLVIGDSHTAMIIKAWRGNPVGFPLLDLEFLAQPGNGPRGVEFSRNQIRAREFSLIEFLQKTDCALDYDLTKFDFIAVVGCGLSLYPVLPVLNKYSVVSSPSSRTKDNTLRKNLKNPMLSLGCFRALIADILRATTHVDFVANLRANCDLPIVIIPQPLPSEKMAGQADKGPQFERVIRNKDATFAYSVFLDGVRDVAAGFSDVAVIAQPDNTIAQHIYTKLEFTAGATTLYNLNKAQPIEDTLHANALFGALVLDALNA